MRGGNSSITTVITPCVGNSKSLRLQIAHLGLSGNDAVSKAIYILVDKIEVLEKEIAELRQRVPPTDAVARKSVS